MDKNGVDNEDFDNEDFEVTLSTTQHAHGLYLEFKGDDIDKDVLYLLIKE